MACCIPSLLIQIPPSVVLFYLTSFMLSLTPSHRDLLGHETMRDVSSRELELIFEIFDVSNDGVINRHEVRRHDDDDDDDDGGGGGGGCGGAVTMMARLFSRVVLLDRWCVFIF